MSKNLPKFRIESLDFVAATFSQATKGIAENNA